MLALLLLPSAAVPPPPRPDEVAFVEVRAEPRECFAGQAVRLRLRFGLEREFAAESLVPLFARPLDVPVHVEAGWAEALPGGVRLPDGEPAGLARAAARHTFALDGETAEATRVDDETVDGRAYLVFELESRWRPRPGETTVRAPRLSWAAATRFEEDFAGTRVALDRAEGAVVGEPLTIVARGLPEEGRPPDFGGAVGSFALRASAEPRELAVGRPLVLTLTIEGDGDLGAVVPPRLDRLDGFDLLGSLAPTAAEVLTAVYHLAPNRPDVTAVPAVTLPYFDPGPPPAWRTAQSEPIPIVVRPAPEDPGAARGPRPRDEPAATDGWSAEVLAVGATALALAALAVARRRRARRSG